MSDRFFKAAIFCGALIGGTLQTDTVIAGAAPVGTTPVFIPPNVGTPPGSQGINATTTDALVSSLNQATTFCSALPKEEYVIDCLAERLEAVSRQYAGYPGYNDARKAIDDASDQLRQIARDNRSSTQNRARFKSQDPNGVSTSRPLTPVDPAKLESAVAEALIVIGNTETLLLRSADTSVERVAQFQQIADAVGSNKVLLRSL